MNPDQKAFLAFARKQGKSMNMLQYTNMFSAGCIFLGTYFMSAVNPATWILLAIGFAVLWLAFQCSKLARRYETAVDLIEYYLNDANIPTKAWKNWLFRALDKYDVDNETKFTSILHGIIYNFDRSETTRKDKS